MKSRVSFAGWFDSSAHFGTYVWQTVQDVKQEQDFVNAQPEPLSGVSCHVSWRIGRHARFNPFDAGHRKCRMMGSAALDLAYVASGRYDAYIERSVNLWDIAAGALLVEQAGGKIVIEPSKVHPGKLAIVATNGKISLPEVE